ncbi:MAG TPA: 16S rRNA (cytidine(1402)-2'-O)-methyltransferase, partial [Candidatus Limnocylindrales bacterium]|nr:16S rRNA (cytidine(1402)-2'-O)-methyltransferase [Candidatus Limnocylindrales bacterium]
LYLVATPIGNLGDVTFRAIEVLRSVPLIAAEDTRIARRLLGRYEVPTRTVSYHARSGPGRLGELVAHLRAGADLALVTDAGTPAVSDPGMELAAAWAAEGGRVEAIPGASSVLAAVAVSGIAGPQWVFEGFLPRSGRARRDRLAAIAADERGAVIFEAPGRLRATLADLTAACGPERPAAVCRELTKLHEQVVRGSLADLGAAVDDGTIPARGEVAVVVGWSAGGTAPGAEAAAEAARISDEAAALAAVEALVTGGLGRAEAARRVAAATGIPRRRLYRVRPDRVEPAR